LNRKGIRSIIEKRLIQAPSDIRAAFPPVLRQDSVLSMIVSDPDYLIIVFLTAEEAKRLTEGDLCEIEPLAGLVTTGRDEAIFRVEKARYATARSCTVVNSYGFSLGPDCTLLLEDHHQVIETDDAGTISYTVPLAYILSYGDDINSSSVYEHLEGLIAYSTNLWMESTLPTLIRGTKSPAALTVLQRATN